MDSSLSIGYLADHPEWVEELANQHWEEWRDLAATWGLTQASEDLLEHTKELLCKGGTRSILRYVQGVIQWTYLVIEI